MKRPSSRIRRGARFAGAAVGAAVGAAALGVIAYAAPTWLRYGRVTPPPHAEPLLDRFMPAYEIVERHEVRVAAPAAITFDAARRMDLYESPLVRAIFRGRELLMRADAPAERAAQSLVDECLALGWGVLAEEPGREIVLGAVTKPWEPNVRFQALSPERFASFNDPGYVKIVWNIAADSTSDMTSVFRTETRATSTDAFARTRFRRYWSLLSPGIILIRRESLRLVRRAAEMRFRAGSRQAHGARREATAPSARS